MSAPAIYFRQFRYWTFHCALNAVPSFIIAHHWMKIDFTPMLVAIATFILLYTIITSALSSLANPEHILSRSLKLGAKIRAWISVISIFFLFKESSFQYLPDYWCGVASFLLLNQSGMNLQDLPNNFPTIYLTTLIEGFILSFMLLMISFGSLMFLQARARKKFFAPAIAP